MTKRMAWLLAILAFCTACEKFAEGRVTYRELLALRDQVEKEFHEQVADVTIADGSHLKIKFINSPYRLRTREQKQQRADAVAAFVMKNYKQPLASVSIQLGPAAETYVGQSPINQ